jgi:hypothetical protein
MNLGGGTSTALPWHGEPSNDGNKAEPLQIFCLSLYMHNMLNRHNFHDVQYANKMSNMHYMFNMFYMQNMHNAIIW